MNELKSGETLDDLRLNGLFLIQKADGFKFGVDAVLLSDFAAGAKSRATLDLCTGNGIIPVLLSAKSAAPRICGLEIQEDVCEMANRSVRLNALEDRVEIKCGDLKDAAGIYGRGSFDKITCNPPYMKSGAGLLNGADSKIISRHEVMCTLEDVIRISSELLVPSGKLFMVHRPTRLADIICLMRGYKIEPKLLRLVYPAEGREPNLVLISGAKGGGSELKIMPPLYLFSPDGVESDELKKIYNRS